MSWAKWSPEDVCDWVDSLLGPGFGDIFRQRQVDGPTLMALSSQDLAEGLGIADPLHRAKLLGHLRVMTGGGELPPYELQEAQNVQEVQQIFHEEQKVPYASAGHPQEPGGMPNQQPDSSVEALTDAVQLLDEARQEMLEARWATEHSRSGRPPPGTRPLSRSQSTAQTISAGYPSSFTANTSRYSGYLGANRNPSGLVGLTSLIGLDSPSNSLHGSFNRAPKLITKKPADCPGPGAYEAAVAERATGKNTSPPRATIGNSTRQPLRRIEPGGPGPHSYNTSASSLMKPTSPRPTIGNSPKEISRRRWDADLGGCPTFYSNSNGGLNLRPSSPRAVFGNARRDCSKFLRGAGQGAEPSEAKDSLAGNNGSGQMRRNLSGLGQDDNRTLDARTAPFGTAARVTSEFIVRGADGELRSCQSPARKDKVSGGVIGSAPRFRSGSPLGIPIRSNSPGPSSYRPSPAFLSNFAR